jgi:hypothetical protein
MGNNNIKETENLHIRLDENNVICIDPNSIVNQDNLVEPRHTNPENLVMFVNLEADLIPRTVLSISDEKGKGRLSSIAGGTLNLMRNQNGRDFDSSWTDYFDPKSYSQEEIINLNTGIQALTGIFPNPMIVPVENTDNSGQGFGIDSISMQVNAIGLPKVTINFIDVRGKTLMSGEKNSPYASFFHLPWPIFYLTIKGYYGKAIRYRLHMTSFTSKYNDGNGNFDITCTFVGQTYAFFSEIPLNGILAAPYLYYIEKSVDVKKNDKEKIVTKRISKSSKGYTLLTSIYDEYKTKGLIAKDFPVLTLRELISKAKKLDTILEKQIFGESVDYKVFGGLKELENVIQNYVDAIKAWTVINLSNDLYVENNIKYFKLSSQDKTETINILGPKETKTLEYTIKHYNEEVQKIISYIKLQNKETNSDIYKKLKLDIINNVKGDVKSYYKVLDNPDTNHIAVNYNALVKDVYDLQKNFNTERDKVQNVIERKMNDVVKDKTNGLGFDPTIRNVFAVVLANAEVFVRFLKDVHFRAYEIGPERKKYLTKDFSEETPGGDSIYPWPKIVKPSFKSNQKELSYPGTSDLVNILKTNDKLLWPEIDFLEAYISIITKKEDTLADKEGGVTKTNLIFEDDKDTNQVKPVSDLLNLIVGGVPYTNKNLSSVLYEIYERGKYISIINPFTEKSYVELAKIEFENIQKTFEEDFDIIEVLKKVQNDKKLRDYLQAFSSNDKYLYYLDNMDTTMSIQYVLNNNFDIRANYIEKERVDNDNEYVELPKELQNYKSEEYRTNVYPFNSTTYLSYINKTSYDISNLTYLDLFRVETKKGFINTPNEPKAWIGQLTYLDNMFKNTLKLKDNEFVNILNTPYFHKQLYSDFTNGKSYGKYAGSAYLLLNSLPYKNLEDTILFTERLTSVRMSDMLKEIASTHYIPYHLILKWGSLYHRYKKKLLENEDILSGFLNGNTGTTINGSLFFDNNSGHTFGDAQIDVLDNVYHDPIFDNYLGIKYSYNTELGVHPFYDAIFHQVIHDYTFYDVNDITTYYDRTQQTRGHYSRVRKDKNIRFYTNWIKNSEIDIDAQAVYTVLPSDGSNATENYTGVFSKDEQNAYRIIWTQDENVTTNYSNVKFNGPNEYLLSLDTSDTRNFETDKNYFTSGTYRNVMDLIATFNHEVLEAFENYFLEFSSDSQNVELKTYSFETLLETDNRKHEVKYQNFQELLKEIATVPIINKDETDHEVIINSIIEQQEIKLKKITTDILGSDNMIKITISNPREMNMHVLDGFSGINTGSTLTYEKFETSQITTGTTVAGEYTPGNSEIFKLYIGEDLDGNYSRFFTICDVEFSEENIKRFRPLIYIFAGGYKANKFTTKTEFKQYLVDNIVNPYQKNFGTYLVEFIANLNKVEFKGKGNPLNALDLGGYNNDSTKLDLYNYFKSFNDKWASGNSMGQKSLMEEFLFLDRANRDIGDLAYIDISRLIDLEASENDSVDLYSVCNMLIGNGQGFDMKPMPAYVNFYGTNFSGSKQKIKSSRDAASSVFGTFLDVDYEESSPKIIIQYIGNSSKNPDMGDISSDYKFNDDSHDIGSNINNPMILTNPEIFSPENMEKSNKVVAFDVSVGDQNQGIFKGVQVSQDTIKNTTETFKIYENMGRSSTGAAAYQIDSNLYDVYRQASYSCEITMMGCVMIQPTMYFYLKNIPIFKGTYLITDVSHDIKGNKITTRFKGARIPKEALPTFEDSFTSSYKSLFDKITNNALSKFKQETEPKTTTEQNVTTPKGSGVIDNGTKQPNPDEKLELDKDLDLYGVPYNGYKEIKGIQKVTYKGETFYKAKAVRMGSKENPQQDSYEMQIINKLSNRLVVGSPSVVISSLNKTKITWADIKDSKNLFYATKFDITNKRLSNGNVADKIINATTIFLNPDGDNGKGITVKVDPVPNNQSINRTNISGAVNVGPDSDEYGISLSTELFKQLGINNGDFIYFKMA